MILNFFLHNYNLKVQVESTEIWIHIKGQIWITLEDDKQNHKKTALSRKKMLMVFNLLLFLAKYSSNVNS